MLDLFFGITIIVVCIGSHLSFYDLSKGRLRREENIRKTTIISITARREFVVVVVVVVVVQHKR